MNAEEIREAMFEVEGYHKSEYGDRYERGCEQFYPDEMPKYEDHNDLQQVIDNMRAFDLVDYCAWLKVVVFNIAVLLRSNIEIDTGILKATPRQKCEAILKAKGLWE